jgi:hypothetical protein
MLYAAVEGAGQGGTHLGQLLMWHVDLQPATVQQQAGAET